MGEPGAGDATGEVGGPDPAPAATRQAFLEAAVDASFDAVFGVDTDGTVCSCNRTAERIFGWAEGEVVGRAVAELFPDEMRPTIAWLLGIVDSGDRIERFEIDVERRGGMPTPISLTLCPVTDEQGKVAGVAAVAHDLTEQRIAQATLAETEARLQEGEALAHIGRWLWDIRSGTVQWSDELHRIHGIDPWEFAGDLEAHFAPVVPGDRHRVAAALEQAVALGRPFEQEYDVLRPDGDCRHLYARAEPTIGSTGDVVGIRGIIHDTSARPISR